MLLNFSGSSLRKFASANAAKLLMGGVATTAVLSRMSVAKELEQLKRELANVDSSKPAGIDQLKTKYILVPYAMPNKNTERDLAATRRALAKTKEDLQQREQELRTSHERKLETPNELESKETKEELGRENENLETKIEELDKKDKELQATRAELNTTIEALETVRKELRETQSKLKIKEEELKTTKEELKTTKEELKSDKREQETSGHKEEKSSTESPVNGENIVSSTVAAAPPGSPPGPPPGPPGPPGGTGKKQVDFIDIFAQNIPSNFKNKTMSKWRQWHKNMTSNGGTNMDELKTVIESLSYFPQSVAPTLLIKTWSENKDRRLQGLNKFRDTWSKMNVIKLTIDRLNMSISDQTLQKNRVRGDQTKIDSIDVKINNLRGKISCFTAQLGPIATFEYKHDPGESSSADLTSIMSCDISSVAISNLKKLGECKNERVNLESSWAVLQGQKINNVIKLYTAQSSTEEKNNMSEINVEWYDLVTMGNKYLTTDKYNAFLEECVYLKDNKMINNSTSSFTTKFRDMLKNVHTNQNSTNIDFGLDYLCEIATSTVSELRNGNISPVSTCLRPMTMWESIQHTILTSPLLNDEIIMLNNLRDYNPTIAKLLANKEYYERQQRYIKKLASDLETQLLQARKYNEEIADLNYAQNVHVAFLRRKRILMGDKNTKFAPDVPSIPYYMYYNGLQPLAQLEVIGKMLEKRTDNQKNQIIEQINKTRDEISTLEKLFKSTLGKRYDFISNYLTSINDALKALTIANPLDVLNKHINALQQADYKSYNNARIACQKISPVNTQLTESKYAYDKNMDKNQLQARDITYKNLVKKHKSGNSTYEIIISDARSFIIDDNSSPVGVDDYITQLLNTYGSFQKNEEPVKNLEILRNFVVDSAKNSAINDIFTTGGKTTYTYEQIEHLEQLQIDILGKDAPADISGNIQYNTYYEEPLARYYFIPTSLPWDKVDYDFLHDALLLQKTLIDKEDNATIERFQQMLKDTKLNNISEVKDAIQKELEKLRKNTETVHSKTTILDNP